MQLATEAASLKLGCLVSTQLPLLIWEDTTNGWKQQYTGTDFAVPSPADYEKFSHLEGEGLAMVPPFKQGRGRPSYTSASSVRLRGGLESEKNPR